MEKVIRGERFRSKTVFLTSWPLEAKPLTLGQIWRNLIDGECNYLSNAVFGFALAIIVPEIMEVFRNDVWQSRKTRKFCHFLALGATILALAKNWTSFVIIFDELSNLFFRSSLQPIGAEIDGGVFEYRWWNIWSASGARVNLSLLEQLCFFEEWKSNSCNSCVSPRTVGKQNVKFSLLQKSIIFPLYLRWFGQLMIMCCTVCAVWQRVH